MKPALPGFGQTQLPPRSQFQYTFDNIANVIDRFTQIVGFDRFAIYVFDYGAPTGFRIAAYWQDPSATNREALRAFLAPATTRWQYVHGVADESAVSPHGIALYPAFQRYFRTHRPRLLAVWGRHDPFFLPAGAESFRRDIPDAEVRCFDTGHFALETHAAPIADAIRAFLK